MAIEQDIQSKPNGDNFTPKTLIQLLKGVNFWFKTDKKFLDIHNDNDRRKAIDALAEGRILVVNWNGVQGLSCMGSNPEAVSKIAYLKQRKLSENPLIMAAGVFLRQQFIDRSRLPSFMDGVLVKMYELPHFFEFPANPKTIPEGIGKNDPDKGRVVAIFDANYNRALHHLESDLYDLEPNGKGFFAGSSANFHRERPAETAKEAYGMFGGFSQEVPYYLIDSQMERSRTFRGSHPMLGFNILGDRIVPLRGGNLTMKSFRKTYCDHLEIPDSWKDSDSAKYVDLDFIRSRKSYV